jgi:hypothetical protein
MKNTVGHAARDRASRQPARAVSMIDRDFPAYDGTYLAPNYYCRARNTKRQKYCKRRSGAGTAHLGIGRCSNHGGNATVKHGRFRRRYETEAARSVPKNLRRIVKQTVADPIEQNAMLDMMGTHLAAARRRARQGGMQ